MSVRWWVLSAVGLVVDLLFCAYFVCVQINAIAYLAGKGGAIITGMKPPVPIDSGASATGDILAGLPVEAFTGLVGAITLAVAVTSHRNARRRR